MARNASALADDLLGHMRRLDATRRKLEGLFSNGKIKRHDIEQVYVGLYLDAIVSFERFIEELFFGYLTTRLHTSNSAHPRLVITSNAVARDIVLGGKNYVDWFPYDQTVKRANAFFTKGQPFTSLDKNDKSTIDDLMTIRNAMAHKSHHSIRQFEKRILSGLTLTSKERTPAGYLRSIYRTSPTQTRYENLIIEAAGIARKLAV